MLYPLAGLKMPTPGSVVDSLIKECREQIQQLKLLDLIVWQRQRDEAEREKRDKEIEERRKVAEGWRQAEIRCREIEERGRLAQGWRRVYSREHSAWFYSHPATKTWQWGRP